MTCRRGSHIRWIGDRATTQYTALPNELARHEELSLAAKGLAAYLWSHRDGWEISIKSLADACNSDPKTVRRKLDELVERHWIAVRETGKNSKDYYLHPSRQMTPEEHGSCTSGEAIHDQAAEEIPASWEKIPQQGGRFSPPENEESPGKLGSYPTLKKGEPKIEEKKETGTPVGGDAKGERTDSKTEDLQAICLCCGVPKGLCSDYIPPTARTPVTTEEPPF